MRPHRKTTERPAARQSGRAGGARATPRFLSLLAALFVCSPSLGTADRSVCLPEPGAPALVLSAGQLLEEPARRVVWETSRGEPTGLACAPGVAVVSVAGETRGRLVWLGKSESGWRMVAETELKGVPRSLRLIRGRAAALLATRRDVRLVVQDGPEARPVQRELVSPPSCLSAMPGEDLLLVGTGSRVMTFRAASVGTWLVYDFDEEITACEARSGARGLLVAHGPRLVLVDPSDPARRGRLPVRAEATFDGPITELAWTGAGEVAAVRLAEPDRIFYVRGSDLESLGAIALRDARPGIVPLAAGWVLWSTGSGTLAEHRLDDTALTEARPLGPLPRPAPERMVEEEEAVAGTAAGKIEEADRASPTVDVTEREIKGAAEQADRVPEKNEKVARDAPHPDATERGTKDAAERAEAVERAEAAERVEGPERPAPPAERPQAVVRRLPHEKPVEARLPESEPAPVEPSVEPGPADPAPPPEIEPEPAPARGAPREAPAAPIATPPTAAAPPEIEPEPAPARGAPREAPAAPIATPPTAAAPPEIEPEPAPPGRTASEPPARAERAAGGEPASGRESSGKPAGIEPLPRTIPGAAIAGVITGEVDLVVEIVILGPDSVLTEYRRIAPERLEGRAVFRLGGVPAGTYRVLPMGRGGGSLLARPAFQSVGVTAEAGGRADFEIVRALP